YINTIGIIGKRGLLRSTKGYMVVACYTLHIVVIRQFFFYLLQVGIVFKIQLTDRRKKCFAFVQYNALVGHVILSVQYQHGQYVIVVVFVFMMIGQVVVFFKRFQQGHKIVLVGYIQLGNIATAQAKIQVHIIGQAGKVFHGFVAG